MGIGLETDAVLAYSVGLLILYLLGSSLIKVFKMPIKIIITFFVNSIVGGILLFAINIFAENFNFQIGVNPINAMIVGVLGIPGLVMLILLRLIL